MKKIIIAVLLALMILVPTQASAFAAEESAEEQLAESTKEQLDALNLSALESLLAELSDGSRGIFGSTGFREKIDLILSGEFRAGHDSVFSAILSLVFLEFTSVLPYFFAIIAIAVLGSLLMQMRPKSSGTQGLIYFSTFGAAALITCGLIVGLIALTKSTIESLQTQINVTFPVLFTLMTALGNVNSVAAYRPTVAFLAVAVTQLMTAVVLPLFIFSVVFSVVGSLSPSVKLTKTADFFSSLAKWIMGVTFTVFTAFMMIQGISAAAYDGISVRTAKYAISKYIPLVGGFLSEGFNLMLAGSVLIKNAVGIAGLLLTFAQVLVPVLKIAVVSLGLKLTGAILEPIDGGKISAFVTGVSKHTASLSAVILSVAFMYIITVLLIVCTGNSVAF